LDRAGYAEAELVENRVAVLIFGGTAAERQAWAEEAAIRLGTAAMLVADGDGAALSLALAHKNGVVFVNDALALGDPAQQQLVRCLQTQEERPKLVIGLGRGAEAALGTGGLRADLHYRLRLAQVNLDLPGLREIIARRRARGIAPRLPPARRAANPPAARPAARSKPAKRRAVPAKRRAAAKKVRKSPKLRRASGKRSRR
jgi:hypothetical protein